jgi:hypothetical protein
MATTNLVEESVVDSSQARRRIRLAGYAALAFAAFQLSALPLPLHRVAAGWTVEWASVGQVAASLILAAAALRGSVVAALVLGAYGAYRAALFGLAVIRILDGTAAANDWGPAWVLGAAIGLPFAVFWVRGGHAALSLLRARRESAPGAI